MFSNSTTCSKVVFRREREYSDALIQFLGSIFSYFAAHLCSNHPGGAKCVTGFFDTGQVCLVWREERSSAQLPTVVPVLADELTRFLRMHPATRRAMDFKAYQYFGPIICLQANLKQGNEFRSSGETSSAKR